MSKIPEHEPKKRKTKTQPTSPMDPTAEYAASDYRHSSCVAEAIDGFASIFSTFVTQARNGDNGSGLYSSPGSYPVKVVLASLDGEDEALHSVELELAGPVAHSIADSLKRTATAFERIADAMTEPGVNKPS